MPGFNIGPIKGGFGLPSARPYMSYAWELEQLFGKEYTIPALRCTLPTFTARPEQISGSALVYKFAGEVVWEDVRLSFYSYPSSNPDSDLVRVLQSWRDRIWTPEKGLQSADKYKRTSRIKILNNTHEFEYYWRLVGSWPQTIRDGELDYATSDVKIVEVVVSYDWAETEGSETSSLSASPPSGPPGMTPL